MNVRQTVIIAFTPLRGTLIYLGIFVLQAFVYFIIIEPVRFFVAIKITIACLLMALSLKLFMGAIFGLFAGNVEETLPRGAMLLMALLLSIVGMILIVPFLQSYQVEQGLQSL